MSDLVVIGLGYVGMPLVRAAVGAGLSVTGFDVSDETVAWITGGRSHIDDLSDADIEHLLTMGFAATTDESVLSAAATIVICVPTPLSPAGGPDLSAIEAAGETIGRHLAPGTLVVLESTTWPGTTEEFLRPLLEKSGLTAGIDFHLAFSPERIDPGNSTYGLRNTPKVVGGMTAACADLAVSFYSAFIDTVVRANGTREAEMAKLLENTYRQVNIALVNEMAKFSHDLGIDIWDVIRCASTKPFGFQPFYPGPGVGGHCIPIDPSYLSHRVQEQLGYPFKFVELAQEVNRSMPNYVASRAGRVLAEHGKTVSGSRILLLGVTYKAGISDQRESPARPLGDELLAQGADLTYFDPFVPKWQLSARELICEVSPQAAESADLVILLQPHSAYPPSFLEALNLPVLDTRGTLTGQHVTHL